MYQSPQSYPREVPLQDYAELSPPCGSPPTAVETPSPPLIGTIVTFPHQNMVVVAPPPTYKDYLGFSIFTLICCCFPFGLAALIFSCKTQNSKSLGDVTSAASDSRLAFILNMVALGLGLTIYIVCISYSSYMIATGRSFYIRF